MKTQESALLCNSIRYPDLWYPIYLAIRDGKSGKKSISSLLDPFSTIGKRIDEACTGLLILEMLVERNGELQINEKVLTDNSCVISEFDFKFTVLEQLRSLTTRQGDKWTKQSHFLYIYKYFLETNKKYCGRNDEKLAKEVGYYLKSNGCNISYNIQKQQNWTRIASYLGLAYNIPGGVVIAPDSRLFRSVLKSGREQNNSQIYSSSDFLELFNQKILLLPFSNEKGHVNIPEIISFVLWNLEKEGTISFITGGDRNRAQLNGVPLLSDKPQVFTQVEVRI